MPHAITDQTGDAAGREQAEEKLRRAPARIRELAHIPITPRDAKPPAWSSGAPR